MGLMDKLKQVAKGRSAMVEKGIDSAVSQVDKRTKGKYRDKLSKGAEDLKEKARRLDEEAAQRGDPPAGGGNRPPSGGPPGPTTGPGAPTDEVPPPS